MIYVCRCLHRSKQYIGESNIELRVRMHPIEHARKYEVLSEPFLDDNDLYPIQQISAKGSYILDKINRLNRETFSIDTLSTLEPRGLNKCRYKDVKKATKNYEVVPFVVPSSKTAKWNQD